MSLRASSSRAASWSAEFAWPGGPYLGAALVFLTFQAGWFALVYAGCDWATLHRTLRLAIHFPMEHAIPFLPGTVVIYLSIYLLMLAAPFILRERRDLVLLIWGLPLSTLVAGIIFLLLPAEPPVAPRVNDGIWAGLFRFADALNLTYNTLPSLHVALSVCCVSSFARKAPGGWRVFLWSWAAAIRRLDAAYPPALCGRCGERMARGDLGVPDGAKTPR